MELFRVLRLKCIYIAPFENKVIVKASIHDHLQLEEVYSHSHPIWTVPHGIADPKFSQSIGFSLSKL